MEVNGEVIDITAGDDFGGNVEIDRYQLHPSNQSELQLFYGPCMFDNTSLTIFVHRSSVDGINEGDEIKMYRVED